MTISRVYFCKSNIHAHKCYQLNVRRENKENKEKQDKY